jgi:hypothetical protein
MSETQTPTNDGYVNPVPAALRRASERANEIARQAGIRNVPEAENGGEESAQPPPPEAGSANQFAGNEEHQPQPIPDSQQQELPAAEVSPTPAAQTDDWEQRYRSLQGRFDAEVAQQRELRGEVRSLRDLIGTMQSQGQPEPRQRAPEPASRVVVPQEDIENFGGDLVHAVQRWSHAERATEHESLERRVLALEGRLQQVQTATVTQGVDGELNRMMPNWRDVNNNSEFHAWLAQVDPFSGQVRLRLANEAYAAGDAARVLAFIQAYLREHTAVTSPGIQQRPTNGTGTYAPSNGATPPDGNGSDRLPLEELAAPGRGGSPVGAPGATERTKRTWTGPEITAAYDAHRRGEWRDNPQGWARVEQDIFAAMREGRIRQ